MGRQSNIRDCNGGEAAEVEGVGTAAPGAWSATREWRELPDQACAPKRVFSLGLWYPARPEAADLPWPGQERHLRVPTPGQGTPRHRPSRLCPSRAHGPRPGSQPPRPPTGAQGHTEGCRLSAASASSRSMGSGAPNLLSPHAEEEKEKEGSAGSPPGQLPLASASLDSDRGRKRRLLPPPGAQPGNTLFMRIQPARPHPLRKRNSSREPGVGGGAVLRRELRTSEDVRALSLSPRALAGRPAPRLLCTSTRGPRLGQCPQARWPHRRHPPTA